MNSPEILTFARKLIDDTCSRLDMDSLSRRITLDLSKKMTSTAGYCKQINCGSNYIIQLSVPIFGIVSNEDCKGVVLHELAHSMDHYMYGNFGHGWSWKRCCEYIGCEPKRCHNFAIWKLEKHKKFSIMCKCSKPASIGKIQYRRLIQGKKYRCSICKTRLSPEMVVK